MPRSWNYKSRDAIGQPKRHVYRGPSTAKEHQPKSLRAKFAFAAAKPRRKSSGGGRKKTFKPRPKWRPRYGRPKR